MAGMVSRHKATRQTPGPPRCYLGNPGQVLPQQQAMPPAAPRVLGKMQPETLRTVELVKPDRKSTAIGFSRNRGDEYVIASSANGHPRGIGFEPRDVN